MKSRNLNAGRQKLLLTRSQQMQAQRLLASPESVWALVAAKRWDELYPVAVLVAQDAPSALAQTDPALYRRLRHLVTEARLAGIGRIKPEVVAQLKKAEKPRPKTKKLVSSSYGKRK